MMTLTVAEVTAFVGSLLWPFMRIGAMLMAMPVIGTRLVTVRVRLIAALAITLLVMPLLPPMPELAPLTVAGLIVSIQQVLIGLAMGFMLQLALQALTIAGEAIAMSMGLGFASMVDPANGVNVPVISQFLLILGTLLFLALGGHLMLIQFVTASFNSLPVAVDGITRDSYWAIVGFGSQMFIGAVWVALPALISILVTSLAMGIMTRAAPQLNIFSVGFPVTMLAGFIVLFLLIPTIAPRFQQLMLEAMRVSQRIGGL